MRFHLASALAALALSIAWLTALPGALAKGPPVPTPKPDRTPLPGPTHQALMGPPETALRARLATHVAPLVNLEIEAAELGALRTVQKHLRARKITDADAAMAEIAHPVARKLAGFLRLRAGYGTIDAHRDFLLENPLWPSRRLLRRRMEDRAFNEGGTVAGIKTLFDALPPTTGPGIAAQASAKLAMGDDAGAAALAGSAWRENRVPNSYETGFLTRFGALLTPADHRTRIDRLLAEPLGQRRRARRADAIRRLLPLIAPEEQQLTTARLSVYLGQKGADKLIAALNETQRSDPELQRQLAFRDYRAKRYVKAGERLADPVPAGLKTAFRDADWALRDRVSDELADAGNRKLAYAVIAKANPEDVNERKVQAFRAGWLALRALNDAGLALTHFQEMADAADGPLSRSKAHYWVGRAARAAGQSDVAQEAFAKGGSFLDTFHGALSRVAVSPPKRALTLPLPLPPTDAEVARFLQRDVMQAAVIAHRARLGGAIIRGLFGRFSWHVETETGNEILLGAALADALEETQSAVRAGKAGVARGFAHYLMSYPVHRMPEFEPLRTSPPTALLLSIARQESEFNTTIVSRAGARGVLQVMPITARHVCRQHDVSCAVSRLLSDSSHNARIAAAYIAEQMDVVGGNMILTLTSYNAGPGRTRQWLRQRKDPRSKSVDALDWVYDIPFTETRLYVQKVLSNLQVYRARLGEADPVRVDLELGLPASASAPGG